MDPNIRISEIMSADPICSRPTDSASEIKKVFDRHGFHHLPVVENGRRLVGIISREDFRKLYYTLSLITTGHTWTRKEFASLLARDIMTSNPLCLHPNDTVGLAADIFLANKFHALPIVEDNQLIGIVTTHDLLAYSFSTVLEN